MEISHRRRAPCRLALSLVLVAILGVGAVRAVAADRVVGPGRQYAAIAAAYKQAQPGDTILVHPRRGNAPYRRVALLIKKPNITIQAVPGPAGRRVRLSGKGYDHSGRGSIPRAIFQFNRGADGCVVEGFELLYAHNDSGNAAGVRINQANDITIRNCDIHDNDMGIMSNGDGTPHAAANQRIEYCTIYRNGSSKHPGQNHNLYLGGASAVIRGCDIHHSLTGHNVKSRAHHTRIAYSFIHDSANREFDLVDAAETTQPDSDAVLVGNVIIKDPKCPGNRTVIHFGRDGSRDHDGKLFLSHNTIVTPFSSPVVDLSAPSARAHLVNNLIWDGGAKGRQMTLFKLRNGADPQQIIATRNWLSINPAQIKRFAAGVKVNFADRTGRSPFVDFANQDFRLDPNAGDLIDRGEDLFQLHPLPATLVGTSGATLEALESYRHPAQTARRISEDSPDIGAYEHEDPE